MLVKNFIEDFNLSLRIDKDTEILNTDYIFTLNICIVAINTHLHFNWFIGYKLRPFNQKWLEMLQLLYISLITDDY